LRVGRTNHVDVVAAEGIPRNAVLGYYINLLTDAVKLDSGVIIGAGKS
jgi:hypothetical protein